MRCTSLAFPVLLCTRHPDPHDDASSSCGELATHLARPRGRAGTADDVATFPAQEIASSDRGSFPSDPSDDLLTRDAFAILRTAFDHRANYTAVADGTERWTYRGLYDRCLRLVTYLHDVVGIRPGDRVAILSPNSASVVTAHFACAALRAVVVNVNVHLAPPELAFILSQSTPSAMVRARPRCASCTRGG